MQFRRVIYILVFQRLIRIASRRIILIKQKYFIFIYGFFL